VSLCRATKGFAFGIHQLFEKSWTKTFDFGFCFVGSVCTYPTALIRLILKTGGGNLPLEKSWAKTFSFGLYLLIAFFLWLDRFDKVDTQNQRRQLAANF
ncbi:MAG: hypothetical protein ACI4JM_01480, partial [Oscillospiraceae bacterium]